MRGPLHVAQRAQELLCAAATLLWAAVVAYIVLYIALSAVGAIVTEVIS